MPAAGHTSQPPTRLVVLVSGSGSNLQAIIDATTSGALVAEVVAVISNRAAARAIARAATAAIPADVVAVAAGETRTEYDRRLHTAVARHHPDFVILAGWMRILSNEFLQHYPNRVINLHPALPGELPGLHAIERAFDEFRAGQRTHTGVMVHLVPDEGVDDGPTLATATVVIDPDDTLESLTARIHAAEHRLLVATLQQVVASDSGPNPLATSPSLSPPPNLGAHQ